MFRRDGLERIELPTVTVVVCHRLKTVWLYSHDPNTKDDTYNQLEDHFKKLRYFLQIEVAPPLR